jgi:uncharacterized membrane protein
MPDLPKPAAPRPFRNAVMRGLGLLVPPLLTMVIVLWFISTTRQYVLDPVNALAREALIWRLSDVREGLPITGPDPRTSIVNGETYYRLPDATFVPQRVYDYVLRGLGNEPLPQTGKALYARYVEMAYLRPYYTIPIFLTVFVLFLFLLGKFMAVGLGNFFWSRFEGGFHRLPLVRSVYSAVKQMTDFFLSQNTIQFKRVVAVEYPRRGMWCVGFVTSEGLADVRAMANEAMLGVFLPTSPTSITGYALTVPKRDVIDLDMTIDQAIQFVVSCGLVLPHHELDRVRDNGEDKLKAMSAAPSPESLRTAP